MTEEELNAIKTALAHYAAARRVPGWAKVLADAARSYVNLETAMERYEQTITAKGSTLAELADQVGEPG